LKTEYKGEGELHILLSYKIFKLKTVLRSKERKCEK